MGLVSAVRSTYESSLLDTKANHFIPKASWGFNLLDDGFLRLPQHAAGLGKQIALLKGDMETAQKCDTISDSFSDTRDGICAVRFVFPLYKLFTGQMFWQTDGAGWRRVLYNKGDPYVIPREDLGTKWTKEPLKEGMKIEDRKWKDPNGRVSSDGVYIDYDTTSSDLEFGFVMHSWKDIAMDILVLAARIISPIRYLHNKRVYDLGREAAESLKGCAMALWAIVLSINLYQAVSNIVHEADLHMIEKQSWEVVQGGLDLLALPFDFGLGQAHPALAIIGAALNCAAAVSLLIKEGRYFK